MAKKQTRRSISMNRGIYERLVHYCNDKDVSMSSVAESAILPHIEKWEREQAAKP